MTEAPGVVSPQEGTDRGVMRKPQGEAEARQGVDEMTLESSESVGHPVGETDVTPPPEETAAAPGRLALILFQTAVTTNAPVAEEGTMRTT